MVTENKTDERYETDNMVMKEYLSLRYSVKENPYNLFNDTAEKIHGMAVSKGWWNSSCGDLFAEKCMMIVTEIVEAVDEYRNSRGGFYFTPETAPAGQAVSRSFNPAEWHGEKIGGVHVELIDTLIRLLDLMCSLNINIDELLAMKIAYNSQREYRHGNKKV